MHRVGLIPPAIIIVLTLNSSQASAASPKIDQTTQKTIAKALEWLASKQNADGSWSTEKYPHNTAITSLALLSFLSQGHVPSHGPYGPEVAKGCRFLLASAREDGYLVGAREGDMYCHGLATLALSELWGMSNDDDIKPTLKKAVELIVRSQHEKGGWRYQPNSSDSDISVTITQVMALRAAKNSGLAVPDEVMRKAIAYIKGLHDEDSGGFCYQHSGDGPGFARSAAGICVLQMSGQYDAKEIPRAVEYLKKNRDQRQFYWYGHYYATHALHQVGGKHWKEWYEDECKLFLPKQAADGSWTEPMYDNIGVAYRTAIAVIILSVPADFLPIFQR